MPGKTSPALKCPTCEGTGWVIYDDGLPHKASYEDKDVMQPCPDCEHHKYDQERNEALDSIGWFGDWRKKL